jgi:hypothetical protein
MSEYNPTTKESSSKNQALVASPIGENNEQRDADTGPEINKNDTPDVVKEVPVIASKMTKMINSLGEEFFMIPTKWYKYILLIPETIELRERRVDGLKIKDYPLPQDWGLGTEFYIKGTRVTFEDLSIEMVDEPNRKDGMGRPLPNFPKVTIRG